MSTFLLYGANGYTGRLITRMSSEYGLKPILAGRNEAALREMSAEHGFDYRAFDLSDTKRLEDVLREVPVVLHAAGPFIHTAKPMIEACLRTHVHYTDITGEIAVFETAKRYDAKAREAGIMVMPGIGFDVVPTDSLALYLKNRLPDATHLKLAFASLGGRYSRGTALTMSMGAGEKSAARRDGRIVGVPLGEKGMWVDFGEKRIFVMSIPWGDVSTAYATTGIPNIETYTGASPKTYNMLKYQTFYNWVLRTPFMRARMERKIRSGPAGPTDEQRAKSKSLVWGEVSNASGETRRARLRGPEGYTLTAMSSLLITSKILGKDFKTGFQTPAGCYGADLVMEIPGTFREDC
jgi:short subunit dehydrogenase-like uncharacterized protein